MHSPSDALSQLDEAGLLRKLRPIDSREKIYKLREGRSLVDFSSNDYLGLSRHPEVEGALIEGVQKYGAGAGASRLISGSFAPHHALEKHLAAAKHTEAALTFSSGYAVSSGAIPVIATQGDFILMDKLCHASLIEGAQLSQATLRIFPHNNLEILTHLLAKTRAKFPRNSILIVTESVFSMNGDLCPLREIVELAETYNAEIFLDEAHAFGVFGGNGLGLAEAYGLQNKVAFQMGTFSKAAGLSGGYISASHDWVQLLLNRAKPFVFSTAQPPAIAHAALASLRLIQSPDGRNLREMLRTNVQQFCGDSSHSPIFPLILGSNETALTASQRMETAGFLIPAIRFPTVPRNTARLRISLSAAHLPQEILRLKNFQNILLTNAK